MVLSQQRDEREHQLPPGLLCKGFQPRMWGERAAGGLASEGEGVTSPLGF